MARTALTPDTAIGPYPSVPLSANQARINEVAGDLANGNSFTPSGRDLIIAHNLGASAYTVTIASAKDQFGRTGDIAVYSLAAGEIHVFGPIFPDGWRQADGTIYVNVSNASVKLGVLRLPV